MIWVVPKIIKVTVNSLLDHTSLHNETRKDKSAKAKNDNETNNDWYRFFNIYSLYRILLFFDKIALSTSHTYRFWYWQYSKNMSHGVARKEETMPKDDDLPKNINTLRALDRGHCPAPPTNQHLTQRPAVECSSEAEIENIIDQFR